MARDYRHGHSRRQSFQRKSQQTEEKVTVKRSSFLIWGVALLVSAALMIGFFVAKHFVYQGVKSSGSINQPSTQEISIVYEKKAVVANTDSVSLNDGEVQKNTVDPDSPFYSFYQGLGQTEVIVEAELLSVALEQPYYIQAGSFGSKTVAMEEVNRLKKHGQRLEISALTKGSRTYYRLRAGPFTDRLLMNKQRNKLRKLGVDTLLIKSSK